jgi:hypothetical protein
MGKEKLPAGSESQEPSKKEEKAKAPVTPERQAELDALAQSAEGKGAEETGEAAQKEGGLMEELGSPDDLRRKGIEKDISGLEGVETVEDLREVPVDKLIALEDKHEGILLYAFTDFAEGNQKVDLKNFDKLYRKPTPGTKLKVSFRGNPGAEAQIGAADLFPPSVRRITVYEQGDTAGGRTSTRRIGLKGQNKPGTGFYDAAGYMPIFSGDEVIIGGAKEAAKGIDQAFEEKYRKTDPAKPKERGALDYVKYEKDWGEKERGFISKIPKRRRRYEGGSALSPRLKQKLKIKKGLPFHKPDIRNVLRNAPDMYTYARASREKYKKKTGIDIPESVMFGVMSVESSFQVDVMNKEGSGAGGLFQFMPKTWDNFLDANPQVVERMKKDKIWRHVDRMNWRLNPEIMIEAGYWLATKNMKYLHSKKNSIRQSEFRNSKFFKTGQISPDESWLLYLAHHDGAGGAVKILKYQGLREQGKTPRQAEALVGLEPFQKYGHKFKGGKTIYDKTTFISDDHWEKVRGYGKENVRWATKYDRQLSQFDPSTLKGDGTWGWAGDVSAREKTSGADRYSDHDVLEAAAANPKIEGKTLFIGSSSTVGFSKHMRGSKRIEAKSGRGIGKMVTALKGVPLNELRSMDRVVLQGGVKNNPSYKESVAHMTAMVEYIREKSPNTKIYITEVTPWDSATPDRKARVVKFNDFLNSGILDVDGVVPTYQIMDDGTGHINSALFGKSRDGLHIKSNDRYAGVVADWVTRSEAKEEGTA